MSSEKSKLSSRLIAALLSAVMVIGMIPLSSMGALAATEEHPDGVTISVKDDDGNPVAGASVTYKVDSAPNGSDYIAETTTQTDESGSIEVFPKDKLSDIDFDAADFTLTITSVTAGGYKLAEGVELPVNAEITSADQDFPVTLTDSGIKITANKETLVYDGTSHELVFVTGTTKDDKVSFQIDKINVIDEDNYEVVEEGKTVEYTVVEGEGAEAKKIEKTEAGTYNVNVTVHRDGFTDKTVEKNLIVTIAKADINDIDIIGNTHLKYNGKNQNLVELSGSFVEGDIVEWYVDNFLQTDVRKDEVPQKDAVGKYSVRLVVKRVNYNDFDKTVDSEIRPGDLDLNGLQISAESLTYNGHDQLAISVTNQGEYELQYQIGSKDDLEFKPADNEEQWLSWDENPAMVKDAGKYIIYVRAVKEGYNDEPYSTYPLTVTVAKAKQQISFNNDNYQNEGSEDVTLIGEVPYKQTCYDFSAEIEKGRADGSISYDVERSEDDVASIDSNGTLTVYYPGIITVIATLQGDNNYKDCEITYVLTVNGAVSESGGDYIHFETSEVTYILGTGTSDVSDVSNVSDVISNQAAEKKNDKIKGDISYSVKENLPDGVAIYNETGVLTVFDYNKLASAIRKAHDADDELIITVIATKSEGKSSTDPEDGSYSYGEDTASYTITIEFGETPENPYSITEPGLQDWYTEPPTVTPAEGYMIAKYSQDTEVFGDFSDKAKLDNEGSSERYVCLRNIETGAITDRIQINIQIDTEKPDVSIASIEAEELNFIEWIGSKLFGFYKPNVNIKFTVADETSGVAYITWTYTKDDDATSSIPEKETGTLSDFSIEDGKYVATLTLPEKDAEQLRGYISFTATDVAGNTSDEKVLMADGKNATVVVVDTISPTMSAAHEPADRVNGKYYYDEDKKQHYYNGDVEFTFTVKEANFFEEDVEISVTKDGGEPVDVTPKWETDENDDETHLGVFTLHEDGDYVVKMAYSDSSGNPMNGKDDDYISDVITIDATDPELDFAYDRVAQEITFTVIEHNFRSEDIEVTGTINDINGNDVGFTAEHLTDILQNAEWTQDTEDDDKYTCKLSTELENGIYGLTINYTDISGNAVTNEPDVFIIDHEKPYNVQIKYNKSIFDTVIEGLTLGFYKPDVTVTFTAYDNYGGVDAFSWNYTRQNGASSVNLEESSGELEAVQDKSDKSKFTASITLTATEAEQLRGYISVYATDTFGNGNADEDKITDVENILVVDTISPTMTAAYSQADRMVGTNAFYKGDAVVTFRVTEANFFAEDVVVKLSKDGGEPVDVTPSWIDEDFDNHVGTLILGDGIEDGSGIGVTSVGDGDYVITVEYTDRSTNEMASYTSQMITIDTIVPVIDVQYQNNNVINTLTDSEDHAREYFDSVQTAIVTITEHNFNADDVEFTIIGKNVAGEELDASSLYSASSWSSSGDEHTITLTYSGDANYTFDVAYVDLAENSAEEYAEDYFTVDQTKPTNLSVSYSTSILDTILENVTFGFYNAEMTVTITADDDVSGVHGFKYSYLNAAGVSSVNAELIDELIANAEIEYSRGGRTAEAAFKIPKMVLGRDNQFNGIVEFTATDRSENESDTHSETQRIIVDNIAPNATVEYDPFVRSENDISYYAGDFGVTITVNEANFYPNDVYVMVSKDGAEAQRVNPTWSNGSTDVHTGRFTVTGDGDYIITIEYADKSGNRMTQYTSNQLTIDTVIEAPQITLKGENAQGGVDVKIQGTEDGTVYAYRNEIVPSVSFNDQNYDDYDITMTQVQRADSRSWSKQDLSGYITVDERNGDGDISLFALDKDEAERKLDDGIYRLTVSMTDKANHSTESTVTFTINRFGSVYEYGGYLISLIRDGGTYVGSVTDDLVITEYNASRLVNDSLNIEITLDGRPIEAKYAADPIPSENAIVGESGWFQYQYTISKDNFGADGMYSITLSSEDEAANTPESNPDNSTDENGNAIVDTMQFRVDSTPPEITSIVGLESEIINEQKVDVRYTVYDAISLKSITVYLDGKAQDSITAFDDANNYSGTFTINESSNAQQVRILVEDRAGNTMDTDSFGMTDEDGNVIVPMPVYSFNNTVTVSTNFFVRWYANRPVFWGSIGGVIVLAAVIWILAAILKKKKNKEPQK